MEMNRTAAADQLTWRMFWIVLAGCGFLLYPLITLPVMKFDEGVALTSASRILHGEWPYRDFYAVYPPAHFTALAIIFRLFGESLLVERLANLVTQLAVIAVLLRLTRSIAVAPIVVAVFNLAPMFSYAAIPALALGLLSLAARTPFLAGVFAGLAVVWKLEVGFWVAAATATAWLVFWPGWATVLRWSAGIAAAGGPVLGILLSAMPFSVIRAQLLDIPRQQMSAYPPVPFPDTISRLSLILYGPLVIAILGIGIAFWVRSTDRPLFLKMLALSLWTAAATGQGWMRPDVFHMLVPMLLSAAVVALLPFLWFQRALFVLGLLAATHLAKATYTSHSPGDLDQTGAVQAVQKRTAPGEFIFAGLSRHDRVFVNDVSFYFFAQRPISTYYHELPPGLTSTAEVQRQIIASLEARRVRVVVLANQLGDADALAPPAPNGSLLLDMYLATRFEIVERHGKYTVLERRQ